MPLINILVDYYFASSMLILLNKKKHFSVQNGCKAFFPFFLDRALEY